MSATKLSSPRALGHGLMFLLNIRRQQQYLDAAASKLDEPLGSPLHKVGDVEHNLFWAVRMDRRARHHAEKALQVKDGKPSKKESYLQ